jgi:hypothetical protein
MQNRKTKQMSTKLFVKKFTENGEGTQPLNSLKSGRGKEASTIEEYNEIWFVLRF